MKFMFCTFLFLSMSASAIECDIQDGETGATISKIESFQKPIDLTFKDVSFSITIARDYGSEFNYILNAFIDDVQVDFLSSSLPLKANLMGGKDESSWLAVICKE